MTICCTVRLLKEMGLVRMDVVDTPAQPSGLGEWYAHLFFLARRKCVMFVHAKTYYAFVAYDIKRQDIRHNRDGKTMCVSRATGAVLYDEGL